MDGCNGQFFLPMLPEFIYVTYFGPQTYAFFAKGWKGNWGLAALHDRGVDNVMKHMFVVEPLQNEKQVKLSRLRKGIWAFRVTLLNRIYTCIWALCDKVCELRMDNTKIWEMEKRSHSAIIILRSTIITIGRASKSHGIAWRLKKCSCLLPWLTKLRLETNLLA
jgi:hypothetical protein